LGLAFPDDVEAREWPYEILVGGAILAAPVVEPGARSRSLYLPEGLWVDYWTGEARGGGEVIEVPAPLDTLPLFLRAGAIVPMLDPEVVTLAEATDPGVVTWADRRDRLHVRLAPSGHESFELFDGSTIEVDATERIAITLDGAGIYRRFVLRLDLAARPEAPRPNVLRANDADLAAVTTLEEVFLCEGCFMMDPSGVVLWIGLDSDGTASVTAE
jgi:hypothetical protein